MAGHSEGARQRRGRGREWWRGSRRRSAVRLGLALGSVVLLAQPAVAWAVPDEGDAPASTTTSTGPDTTSTMPAATTTTVSTTAPASSTSTTIAPTTTVGATTTTVGPSTTSTTVPSAGVATGAVGALAADVELIFVPNDVDFGRVEVGAVGEWHEIFVSWIALGWTGPHYVSLAATDGLEYLTGPNGVFSPCTQQSCSFSVRFAPTSAGEQNPTLRITEEGALLGTFTGTGNGIEAGVLTATPSEIEFPSAEVGSSTAPRQVTVINTGNAPLRLVDDAVSGPFSLAPSDTPCVAGSTILESGGFCRVAVVFTPDALGPQSGYFDLEADNGNVLRVYLRGFGVEPSPITVSPADHDFGAIDIGDQSEPRSFVIRNTGDTRVVLSGTISASGPFAVAPNECVRMYEAGDSCTIHVTFVPAEPGAASGVLDIAGRTSAALSGDATGDVLPVLTVTPERLDVGHVSLGSATEPRTRTGRLTVRNADSHVVTLQAEEIDVTSGPFSIDASGCARSLIGGATCDIEVTFAPTASGAATGQVDVRVGGRLAVSAELRGSASNHEISITPPSIDFGTAPVGSPTSPETLTLRNRGPAMVLTGAIDVTGPFSLDASACGGVFTTGATCDVAVTFEPTAGGPAGGQLQVQADGMVVATAALSGTGGTGPVGELSVSPSTIDFGSVALGATSAVALVQVTNTGSRSATIESLETSPPFRVNHSDCGAELAAGASCGVYVVYEPTAAGAASGALSIDPVDGEPTHVALSGSGRVEAPDVSITPGAFGFAPVPVGSSSPPQTFRIRNDGVVSLPMTGQITVPGPFAVDASACTELRALDSCDVDVTFEPTAPGPFSGNLEVRAEGTVIASASLVGTGEGLPTGELAVAPAALDFGTVAVGASSDLRRVNVTNTSESVVTFNSIGASSPFRFDRTDCGTALAAGASCAAYVAYTPTTTGTDTGTLSFNAAGIDAARVTLSGTAAVAQLTIQPGSHDFGRVVLGEASSPQSFEIHNAGDFGVALDGHLDTTWPFRLDVTGCPTTLPAGGSCRVDVRFQPDELHAETGELRATFGVAVVASAALAGEGVEVPTVSITPAEHDFGPVSVHASSPTHSFTIRNHGSIPLPMTGQVTVTGPFALDASACTELGGGATCDVQVSFEPTATGPAAGGLTVSAGGTPIVAAALSGEGVDPLEVDPTAVDFGNVPTGSTSAPVPVAVRNVGSAPIAVTGTTADPFDVDVSGCAAPVDPGASCELLVRFAPTVDDAGAATGSLTIADSANEITVALTGFGEHRAATVTAQLEFGAVAFDSSRDRDVEFTNLGNVAMTITPPELPAAISVVGDACWSTPLGAGQRCVTTLRFTPTTPGPFAAGVDFDTSFGAFRTTLAGSGQPLSVTPAALDLGAVTLAHDTTTAVTVSNLAVEPVALAIADLAAPFDHDAGCPDPLPGGTSCTIVVSFRPATAGDAGSSFTVATPADGSTQSVAVEVSGRGVAAELTVDAVDVGDVALGATGQTPATLRNDGAAPITITALAVPAPFGVADPSPCVTTLAPHAACSVDVTFSPTDLGVADATLTVDHLAGSLEAEVTGRGTVAGLDAVAAEDFGTVLAGATSDPTTVTIANVGNVDLELQPAAVDGPFLAGSGCVGTLAVGAACDLDVRYAPAADADGGQVGQLVVTGMHPDHRATATIDLAGFAATTGLDVAPTGHDFGTVAVDRAVPERARTITNHGNVAVDVTIAGSGEPAFHVDAAGCQDALQPGASCDVAIGYVPHSAGTHTATVAVAGVIGLAGGPHAVIASSVELTGAADEVALGGDGRPVDFGDVPAGEPTDPRTVTVTNGGPAVGVLEVDVPDGFIVDIDGCTGAVLATDESCTITVTVDPTANGPVGGAVVVTTDTGADIAVATVHAVAVSGALAVSPGTVEFGDVPIGATVARQLTITNDRNVPTTVQEIDLGADDTGGARLMSLMASTARAVAVEGSFRLEPGDCPDRELAPGESCTVTLAFAPRAAGAATDRLSITTDRDRQVIALAGVGVTPAAPQDPGTGPSTARPTLPATGTSPRAPITVGLVLIGLGLVGAACRRRTGRVG